MKCQIQWIDAKGKPTPDDRRAVAMIRRDAHNVGGCAFTQSDPFPCCAAHLAQMSGNWSIVERIPEGSEPYTVVGVVDRYQPFVTHVVATDPETATMKVRSDMGGTDARIVAVFDGFQVDRFFAK